MADVRFVPYIVRHCTLKVFDKLGGTEKNRSLNAFRICRGKMAEWKYLTAINIDPEQPLSKIRLTGPGQARERMHRTEKGVGAKTRRFKILFLRYIGPFFDSLAVKTKKKPTRVIKGGAAKMKMKAIK